MRTASPRRVVRFDAFTLDLSRCVLLRGAVEVPLRRQAFDMLRYLAEHPGTLVTKEELVEGIWRKAAVSDDSLVRCVSDIREALGDRGHRIIETVRGRGYLFAVEVEEAAGLPLPSPAAEPDALAKQEPRSRWFRAALAQCSTRRLPLVACGLVVLAGSGAWVVRERTTAELAPHQQAGHYAILGRAILNREDTAKANKEALVLFDKALALDPNSTLALLGYARVMIVEVTHGRAPPEEHAARLSQAETAIERAIKLDPTQARAHLLRGFLWRARRDPDRALAAFQHALALDPNYAWVHAEAGRAKIDVGRADEAIIDIETAIRLAPTEPRLLNWLYWAGMAAVHADRSETAIRWFQKWREPGQPYERFVAPWLAVAYIDVGREDEGRALIAAYLARVPTFTIATFTRNFPSSRPAVARQRQRVTELLRRLGVPEGQVRTGSVR
jgi:DNA-binding winged helix-turn-helix (wHTH) protein/Tfp pilus assembly protein PilF